MTPARKLIYSMGVSLDGYIAGVVFSTTLTDVGPGARLVREDAAGEVARLKAVAFPRASSTCATG
jgi:hypothetical protein